MNQVFLERSTVVGSKSIQVRAVANEIGYLVERRFEPNWFWRLFGYGPNWLPLLAVGEYETEWAGSGGVKYFGTREAAIRWIDSYLEWERSHDAR